MTIPFFKNLVDFEVQTLKAMVEYHHPVIRNGTVRVDLAPPLFIQTCSEVGEERDEFSPIKLSLPEEVREIFFFLLLLNYMCNIYKYVQVFTYVQISSRYQSVGGSAEQPQPVQDGRALSQPKPHPSDRIG